LTRGHVWPGLVLSFNEASHSIGTSHHAEGLVNPKVREPANGY
jgi:hypothetical protein